MKALLVRPNSPIVSCPVPLGLGYVAGALRKERGLDVEILDARNLRLPLDKVAERIRDTRPGFIGISAMNCEMAETHALAAAAKAEARTTPVVVGGAYASANRELILKDPNIDVVVVGEGEATAVDLADAIESGAPLDEVNGIAFRRSGEPVMSPPRPLLEDLDRLEVAWDLVRPDRYFHRWQINALELLQHDHRAVTLFTSRGCPYQCIYCHNVFGKRFRTRSADSVLDEMQMLVHRYGVREIAILDDSFSHSISRARTIAQGILDRDLGLKLSLTTGIRGDRTDSDLLDLLREAGFYQIGFGVESASPRVQGLIRKKLDLDRVKWSIHETARRGILTRGFFVLGFPTETYDEMLMTGNWAAASDLHLAHFFFLSPFPQTEVAQMSGLDFADTTFHDLSTLSVNLSAATNEEMQAAYKRANRRFYSSPRRLARIATAVPRNTRTLLGATLLARLWLQGVASR